MNNDLITTENGIAPLEQEVGVASAVAREQSEIQAAIITAKKFPRNETASFAKAIQSMDRPSLAQSANYSFPRGGKQIVGPSVDLARELARCWTNLRYGMRIVSQDADWIHIKGYALDVENNSYIEAEDEFRNLIERKGRGWIVPDERDRRELINRRGAILVRNCILQLLPPDLVESACERAKQTIEKVASGELKADRESTIRNLAVAFERIGITVAIIEKKLEHPITAINEVEIAELRGIYKSIIDGHSQAHEHFEFGKGASEGLSSETSRQLTESLVTETKKKKGEHKVQE